MYGFNLGGGKATSIDTSRPNRYELGGLTDATFRLIPVIEEGPGQVLPDSLEGVPMA